MGQYNKNMAGTKTSSPLIFVVMILFVLVFVFFAYTFLHESGHALAGVLFGQSLTEFDVSFWDFSAHVGLAGGSLTGTQQAARSAAGAALPLLVWAVCLRFVPRTSDFALEVLKLIASMAVVNTLLAWIVIPILALFGNAPASDDVTNFLRFSGMPPVLLAFTALLLYAAGWRLFLAQMGGLRNAFAPFRQPDAEIWTTSRSTVSWMAGLMAVCVLLVFALNNGAGNSTLDRFTPPQGFDPIAQLDLSTQAQTSLTLTQFSLSEPTTVGVFVVVRQINTTYFDLRVTGPDGFSSVVLHGEGYNAAQDGGLWEKNLPAGTYQIVLNAHQSPGFVSVYWNAP